MSGDRESSVWEKNVYGVCVYIFFFISLSLLLKVSDAITPVDIQVTNNGVKSNSSPSRRRDIVAKIEIDTYQKYWKGKGKMTRIPTDALNLRYRL